MQVRQVLVAALSLALAGAGAVAAGADSVGHHSGPTARRPLNVVLILSDDERIDGNSVMKNVRRLLARHGVTFANYHVTTSECGPSRASILLGEYSHHTGVTDNFGPHSYPAFNERSDLPVWLHRRGYTTALIGKYLNDYTLDGNNRIPPGWDDWKVMDSVPEEKYYDYSLNENGRLVHYGTAPRDYSTTVLTNQAVDFLRRARRPFFLYFAPVAPHLPAIPARQDIGKLENLPPLDSPAVNERDISDKPWAAWHDRTLTRSGLEYSEDVRSRQLESLLALDRSVARIVHTLARRHVLDRTVIFYTSDNGFLWAEHRLGGKLWPYEPSTHVPLVVRTPWTQANGTVNTAPVLNIDLASTISQLAGVTPGGRQDGQSFVPFLHGRRVRWRHSFVIEYLGANKLRSGGPPPYIAIRTKRYLYVEYRRGWRELYDLRTDPYELQNRAGDPTYGGIVLRLHRALKELYTAPPHRTT